MVQCSLHLPGLRISHLFVLCLLFAAVQEVTAQEETVGVQGGRYGVGITSSWPAYGLSGTLQVNETWTAEAVLGFFGTVSHYGGRVWYRFNRKVNYDIYAYGAVGVYQYNYRRDLGPRDTESVVGLGGGLGIEAGLRKLFKDEDFPPIFINAEVGAAFVTFEFYGGFSTFLFGSGIHYRFGG